MNALQKKTSDTRLYGQNNSRDRMKKTPFNTSTNLLNLDLKDSLSSAEDSIGKEFGTHLQSPDTNEAGVGNKVRYSTPISVLNSSQQRLNDMEQFIQQKRQTRQNLLSPEIGIHQVDPLKQQTMETKKSIDTLMISQTGGFKVGSILPSNHTSIMNNTGRLNQTGIIFKTFGSISPEQIAEQQSSMVNPGTISKLGCLDYEQSRQTHLLGSLRSSFEQSQKSSKRQRYGGGNKMIALLGSTLDGTRAKNNRSKQRQNQRQQLDMSVGIKSKIVGNTTMNLEQGEEALQAASRSVRKTVTLDLASNTDDVDQLTASVGSGNDGSIDQHLNSSVQTTEFFLGVVHNASGQESIETRHPTVIQIVETKRHHDTEPGQKFERKLSPIENLMLGTTETSNQRFQSLPRTGRGKINQEQAMLDHLLNTCDDESSEQQAQQQSLEMIKLRKVLMTAMQMNTTSLDKKWSQMTPFERTKIKDCFTELLRDLNKQEKRAQRARGVLDNGNGGAAINMLNHCLTSQTVKQQQRPLPTNPNIDLTWDGISSGSRDPDTRRANFQIMPGVQEDSFILINNELNLPSTTHLLGAKKLSQQISLESMLPKFGGFRNSQGSIHSSSTGIKVSHQKSGVSFDGRKNLHQAKSQETITDEDYQDKAHYYDDDQISNGKARNHQLRQMPLNEPQSPLFLSNDENRGTMLQQKATLPRFVEISNSESADDGMQQFQSLVTHMRVSMDLNGSNHGNEDSRNKGQVIDMATSYDNTSVAVRAAIDLSNDSKLNSTLISFISQKQEKTDDQGSPASVAKKKLSFGGTNAAMAQATNKQAIDMQRLTSLPQPVVELPAIVNLLSNKNMWQKNFSPIKEEPNKIVESTLQAFSLTRQYQQKAQPVVVKTDLPEAQKVEEQAKKIIINQDQFHGVRVTGENIKQLAESQEMFQDALQLEKKIIDSIQNLNDLDDVNKICDTSTLKNMYPMNSGPLVSMSKFSEPIVCSDKKINVASDQEFVTANNLALVTQVFKSPNHQQKQDQARSCVGAQKNKGSRFENSPSQAISNYQQVHQIDSATEKSSLYPAYMISKLDKQSGSPKIQKLKRNKAQPQPPAQQNANSITVVPVLKQQAHQPVITPTVNTKIESQPEKLQNLSPPPLPVAQKQQMQQHKVSLPPKNQNRAFKNQVQTQKRASAIVGWDHNTLNIQSNQQHGLSQVDIVADLHNQFNSHSSSKHGLQKYNSIDAKLQLLEARIAEHDTEQMVILPSGKQQKQHQPAVIAKHGALRRSNLKGKNSPCEFGKKTRKSQNAAAMASLKLCGIRGTSKDLLNPQTYKLLSGQKSVVLETGDDSSSIAMHGGEVTGAAVLLTIDKEDHGGMIVKCFNAESPDEEDEGKGYLESDQRNQKIISPKLVHQLSGLPYAEEGTFNSKKKSHNVSLANLALLPMHSGMLNSSSKPNMLVGIINSGQDNLSSYQIQGTLNGAAECLSESRPFKTDKKMRGTQAEAATPSRVTESMHSLGLVGPAGTNSKKQMMVLFEADPSALMKMNQTTTSAFSPPGDQLRRELMQAGAAEALIATTNSDDDDLDQQFKLPFQESTQRQSFLVNDFVSVEQLTVEEEASALASTAEQKQRNPMIKEHDFGAAQLANGKTMIGNRSQSLAPPIAKMKLDNVNKNTRIIKGAASSIRKKSMFMKSKLSSKIGQSPSQKTSDSGGATEQQIFSPELAPRQKLPRMKNPSVIEPSIGLKQDARTPLHKLLTSDQLEEFQSLLGSKQKWRKFKHKQGLQAELASQSIDQTFMIQPRLRQTAVRPQIAASQDNQQLPELKGNIAKSTPHNISDFLNSSFSKQNTVEHIKRVKNANASRQTKVLFIDPVLGTVRPEVMQSTHQPLSPHEIQMSSTKNKHKKQLMLQTVTKNRTSPFQTSGPFSSVISPNKSTTTSPKNIQRQQHMAETGRTRNISDLNTTMPSMPAVSTRYRSIKNRQSDFSQTFIFNDVKHLKKDLRKNQALIFSSNQYSK